MKVSHNRNRLLGNGVHGSLLKFKKSQQRWMKGNKGISVILKVELYLPEKLKKMLKDS